MADQTPPAMTVRDVAGFLSVDEKTIYRLAQQGKLPGFKVAGTWRFQMQDIQGWIDVQKLESKKKTSLKSGGNRAPSDGSSDIGAKKQPRGKSVGGSGA